MMVLTNLKHKKTREVTQDNLATLSKIPTRKLILKTALALLIESPN